MFSSTAPRGNPARALRRNRGSVTLASSRTTPTTTMTRPQIAAATSLAFSLYWAVMAYAGWPDDATPEAPLPMMRVILCVMFASLAAVIWLGRNRNR